MAPQITTIPFCRDCCDLFGIRDYWKKNKPCGLGIVVIHDDGGSDRVKGERCVMCNKKDTIAWIYSGMVLLPQIGIECTQ